ncbi:hypothetical protein VQ042_08155 [Aurantimonas sp. A2-1-M11]|uniref:hypothetical protein n=1 Tax=Aurantimonas sp. A2-1-M11 TaxID=3113712 RepID=UPI002F91F551
MNVTDIEDDIARGDIRGIEDGFRALVGWPNEAEIGGGTQALRKALRLCCLNLENNQSIMPAETAEAISEAAGEPIGNTYHDGASAVLDRITYWTMRLQAATRKASA